jgi:hypothetical protein
VVIATGLSRHHAQATVRRLVRAAERQKRGEMRDA